MIRAFADTNWLAALYFNQPSRTRVLRSWSRRHNPVLFVSAPVLLEARNVFARATRERNSAEWQALVEDQGNGLTLTPHDWSEIVGQAEELTDRYAHKGTISSGDLLVVASAVLSGATWFLSFDQNSGARALASVLKLAVFPKLTMRDDAVAAQLKA